VRSSCSCFSASGSSAALSSPVVFPGEVALEVVVDAAAEGNNEDVALGCPKLKPTPDVGPLDVGGCELLPKRPEKGEFGVDPELRFPKMFDVGALVGVASVTLTVGLLFALKVGVVFPKIFDVGGLVGVALPLGEGVVFANRIGVFGFHVWIVGAGEV